MDKHPNASISFLGYRVKKVEFEINDEFVSNDKDIKLDFDFDVEINIDINNNLAIVILKSIIFKDYRMMNKPFYLSLNLEGLFKFDDGLEDIEVDSFISVNAVAILFPYLRSVISNLTINCGVQPVILPTLNISEYFKNKYKKESK